MQERYHGQCIRRVREECKIGNELVLGANLEAVSYTHLFINVPSWVGDPREDLQERLKSKEKFDTPLEVPFITHW